MINPQQDGITHLNIYSKGLTELGRFLTNWRRYKFTCTDGDFESIEGYWYWLGTPNCLEKEQLRYVWGYQAKQLGKQLQSNYGKREETDFERKILEATWIKLLDNKDMFKTPIARLPLEHYYNYSGKVVDVKHNCEWLIVGIGVMRDAILVSFERN